jgi:hypothetical protein
MMTRDHAFSLAVRTAMLLRLPERPLHISHIQCTNHLPQAEKGGTGYDTSVYNAPPDDNDNEAITIDESRCSWSRAMYLHAECSLGRFQLC